MQLVPGWRRRAIALLAREESVEISSPASLALLRQAVRQRGQGLPHGLIEQVALVATSIGKAQLAGPLGGEVGVRCIERDGVTGIELIALDGGPLAEENDDQPALSRLLASLGDGGLEVDVDVRAGLGRLLCVRAFAAAVPRAPEVGIYGRPMPGQGVSGDDASFLRDADGLHIAVVDGLGHGTRAAEASALAIDTFAPSRKLGLSRALLVVDEALLTTRGAVMRVASVSWPGRVLETASAGNVECALVMEDRLRRLRRNGFTLGDRFTGPKLFRSETTPIEGNALLVLFTDGVSSRLVIDAESPLMRVHPALIAAALCHTHAKVTDDALIAVIR